MDSLQFVPKPWDITLHVRLPEDPGPFHEVILESRELLGVTSDESGNTLIATLRFAVGVGGSVHLTQAALADLTTDFVPIELGVTTCRGL